MILPDQLHFEVKDSNAGEDKSYKTSVDQSTKTINNFINVLSVLAVRRLFGDTYLTGKSLIKLFTNSLPPSFPTIYIFLC